MSIQHVYRPRGAARELMENRAAEILLSGPAGTGKSRACLEKILACAVKYPGMKALIVRKTLASLGNTALDTWRHHVAVDHMASGDVVYYGGSAEEPPQYRFSNGSQINIGGMDKPVRIMSSEYDMIYGQEATEFTVTDRENLSTRLRRGGMPYQQLIMDCNPDAPTHPLKQRCDDGTCVMLHSRHEDNPVLFDDSEKITERGRAYMSKLDKLTGVRKQRLRHGRWVAAEGVIFEHFDEATHVIAPLSIPLTWARFWAIDFGFNNPFVLQCWAETPDGRLILYREIYHTKRIVEEHADAIMKIVLRNPKLVGDSPERLHWVGEWIEPRPSAVICDHDAEGRMTFQRRTGLITRPAHKAVTETIEATQKRFAAPGRIALVRGAVVELDEELRDAGRPTSTIEEIPGYVYDQTAVSKLAGKAPKETPLKEDDHGCDGMRYLVAYRDLKGRPGVRFIG